MTLSFPPPRPSGDQPLVTFHDHASGERVELSVATFENWVAKSANLLVEEFGIAPGDVVLLALGTHWTTAVLLFACWRVGALAVCGDPSAPPDTLALSAQRAGAALAVVEEAHARPDDPPRVGVPLVAVGSGMAARLTGPVVADALPFGEEVPAYPDEFDDTVDTVDRPVLQIAGAGDVRLSPRMLLAAAGAVDGLGATDRLLTTLPPFSTAGVVLGLVAPWSAQASVVLVRNAAAAALGETLRRERATVALTDRATVAALPGPPDAPSLRQVLVVAS